ncbi:hypothetical protein CDL15_Pgr027588 [Punica granatum]|uniref:Uncharacterized protein n=1 Tax=Punica granatum TaxID=22663 RepID=A0A218XK01_PUNGR|nr:hypothetical protein CDL15_Pgr027588 [Punica granatum]
MFTCGTESSSGGCCNGRTPTTGETQRQRNQTAFASEGGTRPGLDKRLLSPARVESRGDESTELMMKEKGPVFIKWRTVGLWWKEFWG